MKEPPANAPGNMFAQPPNSGAAGFYEPRQSEEMSLGLIVNSLRKFWYVSVIVSGLMMLGISYKTAKEPRIYKSGIQIAIELKDTSSLAEKLAATTGNNGTTSDPRTTTIETVTQILKSKTIIQKAIDTIPDPELKPAVDQVLRDLTIQSGQNTNILSISYTDTVPQRIVETLNALSIVYIDYSVKTKKARTDKSISFIEAQLPESRKRLETASQEVELFRQKYRFIDPETSTKGLAEYRQVVTAKLNELKVQYSQTEKQYAELKKQLAAVGLKSDNILSTTMLTQDSAYQELFKKLNELELSYSQERVRFSDSNPLVIVAQEKRDQVLLLLKNRAQQVLNREVSKSELNSGAIANFSNSLAQNLANKQAETETTLASLSAQYKSSYQVYEGVERQIAQLPTLQKQYTELQRQYTINSQELTAFLQKLQELKISDAEQVVPWSLLDPPELPRKPISPDVGRQMGLGTIGSLLVGVLAAVGLNKLDNRIDEPETIKSITGLPILTMIPKVDNFEQMSLEDSNTIIQNPQNKNYSYWSFIESIRTLALGIGLTSNREEHQIGKVIAMTSALPKEGKSTITFHTSIALSEIGYRVLLVDVDLHKSTIAKLCRGSAMFQSSNWDYSQGLSDVLLKGDKWQDLLKKSPQSNLDILLSGPQSISSISLLNSARFIQLIEQWRKDYDYIIFDTPPIVGLSDTRLIGSLVDGLIYIVSLNVARRRTIDRALDIIASIKTPVLGLAINRVANHYSGYNKYYNYYYQKNGVPPKQPGNYPPDLQSLKSDADRIAGKN
jgi:polysaccharide biosynthesis transport protein